MQEQNTPHSEFADNEFTDQAQTIVSVLLVACATEREPALLPLLTNLPNMYFEIDQAPNFNAVSAVLEKKSRQILMLPLDVIKQDNFERMRNLHAQFPLTAIVVFGEPIADRLEADLLDFGVEEYLNLAKVTASGLGRAIRHILERQKVLSQLEHERNTLNRLVEVIKRGELDGVIEAQKSSGLFQIVDSALLEENAKLLNKIKEQNNELRRLAHQDSLTNLANRLQFENTFKRTCAHSQRHGHMMALLLIDLDKFKVVNDSHGHQAGDLLLQQVSERLQTVLRQNDFVARLGGDEFAVILQELKAVHGAGIVAEKIIDAISLPYSLGGEKVSIGCSIGIACYPQDGEGEDILVKKADIAMYSAKKMGSGQFQYSTADLHDAYMHRLNLESALHQAVQQEAFFLVYQPIIRLPQRTVEGMEVLIRWEHSELGFISPEEFIGIAEECGLILPIGRWVLTQACKQLAEWREQGLHDIKIAINLSPIQLEQGDMLNVMRETLAEHRIPIECVEFEVTERAVMMGSDRPVNTLTELSNLGGFCSVDDFGTGYSSLGRLKELPISTLKIDKSFVQGIGVDHEDEVIVKYVIQLANEMGLDTVAEGIETEEQLQFLIHHNCPRAQGYLFSKPLDVKAMTTFLTQSR